MAVLTSATSVDAVLLQLGHASGAEVFSEQFDAFTFDSSERGPPVALTPAQTAAARAALLDARALRPSMHWAYRANFGLRFRSNDGEVRVLVGLEEYGHHVYLFKGRDRQILVFLGDGRKALDALGTELFGPSVTTNAVAPGHTLDEYLQGKGEQY